MKDTLTMALLSRSDCKSFAFKEIVNKNKSVNSFILVVYVNFDKTTFTHESVDAESLDIPDIFNDLYKRAYDTFVSVGKIDEVKYKSLGE